MSDLNIPLRVTERRRESRDCLLLFFARPQGLTYAPGDWMDIRFPTPEFPVGRTYSFASSPTEPDLRITFKESVSPFKKRLERTEPADTMLITQYGSNGFCLDRGFPALFITGGVGITPFRSMIKELVDTNATLKIVLVSQNRTDDFPYGRELGEWAATYPSLRSHCIATGTEGRLTKQTLRRLVPAVAEWQPMSYVAGPPGMVNRAAGLLRALGIDEGDIKTDRFDGY